MRHMCGLAVCLAALYSSFVQVALAQSNRDLLGIPFLSMLNDPNTLANALKLLAPKPRQSEGIQSLPTRQQFNLATFPRQANELFPIQPVGNTNTPLRRTASLIGNAPPTAQRLQQTAGVNVLSTPQRKDYSRHPFGDLSQYTSLEKLLGVENFGIAKGAGCFPLLGDVVKALFSNCQSQADVKALATWGEQWSNVLGQRQLNLAAATQHTCELQAEKTHCQPLSQAVQVCDIVKGIATAQALQQEKERCKQISQIALQPIFNSPLLNNGVQRGIQGQKNPNQFFTQIGQLLGGEVAGALFRNFLQG